MYQADYRKEFPDFDPATMPAIPATWADTSWHNDSCPSFRTMTGLQVFVDFADVALREWPEGDRFTVHTDPETYGSTEALYWSDKWENVLAYVLAHRFAASIRAEFKPWQLAETKRRNATYDENVCATHDFCDANMVMAAAWSEAFGRDIDMGSDADTAIWNQSWGIAKDRWLTDKPVTVG